MAWEYNPLSGRYSSSLPELPWRRNPVTNRNEIDLGKIFTNVSPSTNRSLGSILPYTNQYFSAQQAAGTNQGLPSLPPLPRTETAGSGNAGLIAQERANLDALLSFLNTQGESGANVIRALAAANAETARGEEQRIREEYTPQRVAETEQRFLQAAEGIAAREAEINAAAGNPAGRAGVYVAPGSTQDWEMLLRTTAPMEAQYVSNMGAISADAARSYALAAENEGQSYVGALQNLITTLSFQAQQDYNSRVAGLRASGSGEPKFSAEAYYATIEDLVKSYVNTETQPSVNQIATAVASIFPSVNPDRVLADVRGRITGVTSTSPQRIPFRAQ